MDGDIQCAVPARQGHLLLRAARQSAAVPAPRPEGHAVVVGAEAVAALRQGEGHLPVGIGRAVETCVALAVKGINRQAGIRPAA